jgi:hypothetical protein
MGRKTRNGLSARVREVRDQIALWRRTRAKRSPMPADLWREAVALARDGGTYPIARAVRVDYESLARRVAEAGARDRGGAVPAAAFVELTGAQLLGSCTPPGSVVEMVDADGVRLTIRLAGGAPLDVAEVVHGFRRPRA